MVEYLSGGRIQGSSTASATSTEPTDTNSGWTSTDSTITIATPTITGSSTPLQDPDRIYKALSPISDTKWVVDVDFNMDSITATGAVNIVGFTSGTDGSFTSGDTLAIEFNNKGGSGYFLQLITYKNGSYTDEIGTIVPSLDTDYYGRFTRLSDTSIKFELFSSSARTGTPSSTETLAITTGIGGFTTISVGNYGSGNSGWTASYTVSNIKFYNGVTTVSTTTSLAPPVNTRYEEVDTRKIYRKVDPTTITYESDFADNSTGWNFQATSNITSDRLKVWNTTSPPYGQATYTLSSDVDGDFVLRYRLKWHAGDSYIFIGLYDELPSTLTDTTMDFCESGFYFTNNSNRGLRAYAGANTGYSSDPIASSGASQTGVADTDYYIELIRDVSASTLKLNKYTSSDYTGTPETHTMSSTPSGIDGLKYLKVIYSHDGSTGGTSSYISVDQIKIYAGVTSIDTDEWKERGTA